jgi:hypothetical protein
MDSFDLSIEGISAMKQVEIQNKVGVRVLKGINEQNKAIAAALIETIKSDATGKGRLVNVVA